MKVQTFDASKAPVAQSNLVSGRVIEKGEFSGILGPDAEAGCFRFVLEIPFPQADADGKDIIDVRRGKKKVTVDPETKEKTETEGPITSNIYGRVKRTPLTFADDDNQQLILTGVKLMASVAGADAAKTETDDDDDDDEA